MTKISRIDIMIDIESLGVDSNSTIIQISAMAFDVFGRDKFSISPFNQIADISKNTSNHITGSTIQWWLNTDAELFSNLLNSGTVSSEELLRNFHEWLTWLCERHDVYLWGNGILFDNKIIQHQFQELGLDYPIFYRNDRDVRTLVDLASMKLGITESEIKEKLNDEVLIKHNALDDVIYQIRLVRYCFDVLRSRI